MGSLSGRLRLVRTLYQHGRIYTPAGAGHTAFLVDGGSIAWVGDEHAASAGSRRTPSSISRAPSVAPAFVDAHVHPHGDRTRPDNPRPRGHRLPARGVGGSASSGPPGPGGGVRSSGAAGTRPPGPRAALRRPPSSTGRRPADRLPGPGRRPLRGGRRPALLTTVAGASRGWWVSPDGLVASRATMSPARGRRPARPSRRRTRPAQLPARGTPRPSGIGLPARDGRSRDLECGRSRRPARGPYRAGSEVIGYWGELLGVELGSRTRRGRRRRRSVLRRLAPLPYCRSARAVLRPRRRSGSAPRHGRGRRASAALRRGRTEAGFHAIGDAAIDQVLDAVDIGHRRLGRPAGRAHRVEHAEMVAARPGSLPRGWRLRAARLRCHLGWPDRDVRRAARCQPAGHSTSSPSWPRPGRHSRSAPTHRSRPRPVDGRSGRGVADRSRPPRSARGGLHRPLRGGWRAAGRLDEGLLTIGPRELRGLVRPAVAVDVPDELRGRRVVPTCRATVVGWPTCDRLRVADLPPDRSRTGVRCIRSAEGLSGT